LVFRTAETILARRAIPKNSRRRLQYLSDLKKVRSTRYFLLLMNR